MQANRPYMDAMGIITAPRKKSNPSGNTGYQQPPPHRKPCGVFPNGPSWNWLVVEPTPLKSINQNGFIFPNVEGWKFQKYLSCCHLGKVEFSYLDPSSCFWPFLSWWRWWPGIRDLYPLQGTSPHIPPNGEIGKIIDLKAFMGYVSYEEGSILSPEMNLRTWKSFPSRNCDEAIKGCFFWNCGWSLRALRSIIHVLESWRV